MDLRQPKKKRVGPHIKPQQPFPILIESESGIPVDDDVWPVYFGNFVGDCVVVSNPEEMISLYTMGFFGKGSFSRGYPSFGLTKKGIPPIIKERQWQRRKSWIDSVKNNLVTTLQAQDVVNSDSTKDNLNTKSEPEPQPEDKVKEESEAAGNDNESSLQDEKMDTDQVEPVIKSENNVGCVNTDISDISSLDNCDKVLVLADSDDEDLEKVLRDPNPHLEDEPIKTVAETLNLTLEEAFFLSYALGCLQVMDMTLTQMWTTFCDVQPDFIESYVAYHHFRSKGWVVKSGYKFGGNFLLYKQGPPFYHASYIVLVEKVDSQLQRLKDSMSWTKFHGLNRLAEGSGKDIITCQVVFPDNITGEDLRTPKSLRRFQVNELLTKRWIPSQERSEKEQA